MPATVTMHNLCPQAHGTHRTGMLVYVRNTTTETAERSPLPSQRARRHGCKNHITNCIEKHAPLRMRTRKEKKFSGKPWISESIQKSIDNKISFESFVISPIKDWVVAFS